MISISRDKTSVWELEGSYQSPLRSHQELLIGWQMHYSFTFGWAMKADFVLLRHKGDVQDGHARRTLSRRHHLREKRPNARGTFNKHLRKQIDTEWYVLRRIVLLTFLFYFSFWHHVPRLFWENPAETDGNVWIRFKENNFLYLLVFGSIGERHDKSSYQLMHVLNWTLTCHYFNVISKWIWHIRHTNFCASTHNIITFVFVAHITSRFLYTN